MSLCIREFGKIAQGEKNEYIDIDNITLNKKDWDFLATYANSDDKNHRFIEFVNQTTLRVKNFVGVITTDNGEQIEILPKINESKNTADESRAILSKMLQVVNELPFIETTKANLQLKNEPLVEVLISWFLAEVDRIIKIGIRKDYEEINAQEKFLKGSLQIHKQLNEPPHKQHLFHIEYNIFSFNRAENRLIHSSLFQVLKWSKNSKNIKLAKHYLISFNETPLSKHYKNDFDKYSKNRDMVHYQNILPWLKLILNQQSPFTLKDKNKGISFLIPMEKLFEKYVAKVLANNLPNGYKLSEQESKKHLAWLDNKKVFTMKPDIVISKDGKDICILDTKWKLIYENKLYESGGENNKKGIKQSDMYQLFAYGKKYGVSKVVLIYPQWENFKEQISFRFDDELSLDVAPFSLDENSEPFSLCKTT